MQLRTARKGPNAGKKFWGCPNFPKEGCRATIDAASVDTPGETHSDDIVKDQSQREVMPGGVRLPVEWVERLQRTDWMVEYTNIGSFPGLLIQSQGMIDEKLKRCISQTVFLSNRNRPRKTLDAETKTIISIASKILQRGYIPLPTASLEEEMLSRFGFLDKVFDLRRNEVELGWEWKSGSHARFNTESAIASLCVRKHFEPADELICDYNGSQGYFDTAVEGRFLCELLPSIHFQAAQWIHPQASLDRLLEASGLESEGARRIDFLFCHPFASPLVIELDGPEHESSWAVDKERDDQLAKVGILTIRVPNSEIEQDNGPNLDRVKVHIEKAMAQQDAHYDPEDNLAELIRGCAYGSKLQLAIIRAIESGWLPPSEIWNVKLSGATSDSGGTITDLIQIIQSLDAIYGTNVAPSMLNLELFGTVHSYREVAPGDWAEVGSEVGHLEAEETVNIAVEPDSGPFHSAQRDYLELPDIVVRPTYLPVDLGHRKSYSPLRIKCHPDVSERVDIALIRLLQFIFRKIRFREGQAEAVLNVLKGIDSIILLPTGAGKSLIYQLSGLLLPGITIVIDPIVSLIEDQVEGLRQYGIDRAIGISSATGTAQDRQRLLIRTEKGEYNFVLVSPERLQSPEFRQTLKALAQSSLINLAVIDEAHCVSEWGHDFRPAYLNLGRNLRTFCADLEGSPPPVLGLTGTASRAVLRDMLADLEIDGSSSGALIRPISFDRQELRFDIRRTKPGNQRAVLRGILTGLPDQFCLPHGEFYQPAGRNTYSGIVFSRFVNGESGVSGLWRQIRTATSAQTAIYSGKCPSGYNPKRWDVLKREQAFEFKANKAPLLVSTKAFGMGIDKPNIRYTVHCGMPASLEAFYQEAGRAGRNREQALCYVIFSEHEEGLAKRLVDPNSSLEDIRRQLDTIPRDVRDDTSDSLWFHLNSFQGIESELESIESALRQLGDLSQTRRVQIPFSGQEKSVGQEKAIYRLVQVGVLSDYEVEYGSKKFTACVAPFDTNRCREKILDYVRRSQPGRVKSIERKLEEIPSGGASMDF